MKNAKLRFFVQGMTCRSCEKRIEQTLGGLPGVLAVKASFAAGRVDVGYDAGTLTERRIREAVEETGYETSEAAGTGGFAGIGTGIVIVAAYLLIEAFGGFALLPDIDSSFGYGMIFLAGILTSFHCVAMCGGIALGQCIPAAGAAAEASGFAAKVRPGLLYNGGRVLSYTVIGAVVGALGSVFGFSAGAKGVITGAAGLFMLVLGLRMLGLFRRLRLPSLPLPAFFRAGFRKLSGRGPFVVGLLSGFIPCGPLQTMQLYALGTGSVPAGALSMFLFGLGTTPLLFGFGAAAASIPRKHAVHLVQAGAVLVLFLGAITVGRALTLAGYAVPELASFSTGGSAGSGSGTPAPGSAPAGGLARAVVSGGVQRVVTEIGSYRYIPFMVQAGVPVEWTIRVKAGVLNGCNNPLVVPAYGLTVRLVPGDNLVRFTPGREGTVPYSCWMGMIRSRIIVVSDLAAGGPPEAAGPGSVPGGPGSVLGRDLPGSGTEGAGGSCCSGSSSPEFAEGRVPAETIGMPIVKNGIQEMTITVNEDGYHPAAIVLQRGMNAKFVFIAEALNTCNSPVDFPEYGGRLDLGKGELETPPLEISVDFTFRCWMGMLNGYVKVVDDISRVDVDALRREIGEYRAQGGGDGCCAPEGVPETAS